LPFQTTFPGAYDGAIDDGQIDPPKVTYRVVGICPDNTRFVVLGGLTLDRAEELRNRLLIADAFPMAKIEPESP
jgi:hypothetical protein